MKKMKEQLEQIFAAARSLYQLTDGKCTVNRGEQQLLQSIVDEIQEAVDELANQLLPWED